MAWLAVIVQASLFPWKPRPSVTQPELSMEQYALPEVTESISLEDDHSPTCRSVDVVPASYTVKLPPGPTLQDALTAATSDVLVATSTPWQAQMLCIPSPGTRVSSGSTLRWRAVT